MLERFFCESHCKTRNIKKNLPTEQNGTKNDIRVNHVNKRKTGSQVFK